MKIAIASNDLGSTNAIIPPAKILAGQGHTIIAFGDAESLGFKSFKDAGLTVKTPQDYGLEKWTASAFREVLKQEKFNLVWGGVSGHPQGAEKLILRAAQESGIKTVASYESWPLTWLIAWLSSSAYFADKQLYQSVDAFFVPDKISVETMTQFGFDAKRVITVGNPAWERFAAVAEKREYYRQLGREMLGLSPSATVVGLLVTNSNDDPENDDPKCNQFCGCPEKMITFEYLVSLATARKLAAEKGREISGVIRQKPGLKWNSGQQEDQAKVIRGLTELLCPGVPLDTARTYKGEPAMFCTLMAADVWVGHFTLAIQDVALLGLPAIYYCPAMAEALRAGRPDFQATPNELKITVPFHRPWMLQDLLFKLANEPERTLGDLRAQMRPVELAPNASANVAAEVVRLFGN